MAMAAQKHERAEKERLRKELEDAKARLRKALEDSPYDFTLHSVLGDVVRGLRERLEE
jgi:DNA-binding FadR family transcriptional regulator